MKIYDIKTNKKKLREPWKKYYSKEQLNFEIPDINIYQHVKMIMDKYPDNIAVEYFDNKITFKELFEKIDVAAIGFHDLGIRTNDIITIMLPNVPEVLINLYAINKIGAISNFIHPMSSEKDIKDTLCITKSKVLVMTPSNYEKIANIIDETFAEKVLFVNITNSILNKDNFDVNSENYIEYPKTEKYIDFSVFMNNVNMSEYIEYPNLGKNAPAVIIHSGGTTGTPKHVIIQNRSFILQSIQQHIVFHNLEVGDSFLGITPNFHGYGLSVIMHSALSIGCYVIMIPKFDPLKFDILINETKPSTIFGVPTLYEALASSNNIPNINLSHLKYVGCGGDYLSKKIEMHINKYLKDHNSNVRVIQGYGMTESLACVSVCFDDIYMEGSVGIPWATDYIKIIDSKTNMELSFGEIGEIAIHSRGLMLGYLDNDEETKKALQIHDDGYVWLHTGDSGYMDRDGFLYCTGRIKRMFATSGYNVFPSYVEKIIESHDDVLHCSVVDIPHDYKQNVGVAFIVLNDNVKRDNFIEDLENYCKKKLTYYMIPHKFFIVNSIPKTKLGKVDFVKLKEIATNR